MYPDLYDADEEVWNCNWYENDDEYGFDNERR